MHDSAITLIARYRTETLLDEVLAHHTELMQLLHQLPFRTGLAMLERFLFEPFEEAGQCYGILPHRRPFAFQLNGVFLRFVNQDRGLRVDLLASLRNSFVEGFVDPCTIIEHSAAEALDVIEDRLVRLDVYIVEIQVVLCRRINLVRVYEQGTFIGLQHHVRDHDRIVLHIVSADVEQPCNLVEGADDHRVCFLLGELFTHAC